MSVITQDRAREIAERVQADGYEIDPTVVAQAMISRLVWEDVPDLDRLPRAGAEQRRPPRLRGLVRARRLIAAPLPPAALGA